MASLAEIRAAVKATLEAAISGVTCYDTVPDSINAPAIIVAPATADFTTAMARGADRWEFDLIPIVRMADPIVAQTELDAYVTGAGPRSIRAAVYADRTLGRGDVDAHVRGLSNYGSRYDVAGVDYTGATLRLVVVTTGTA
ncbi:hypothetical protein [Microtetraspora malaysiensis]|uniref:hypothetical protein n=1 Tax=Microtetraspora malaysiensis TaxID=161358 RepID=UPI003D89D041